MQENLFQGEILFKVNLAIDTNKLCHIYTLWNPLQAKVHVTKNACGKLFTPLHIEKNDFAIYRRMHM